MKINFIMLKINIRILELLKSLFAKNVIIKSIFFNY